MGGGETIYTQIPITCIFLNSSPGPSKVGVKIDKLFFCQTPVLGLRLGLDFVFPLSQQQEEEQPSPKSTG